MEARPRPEQGKGPAQAQRPLDHVHYQSQLQAHKAQFRGAPAVYMQCQKYSRRRNGLGEGRKWKRRRMQHPGEGRNLRRRHQQGLREALLSPNQVGPWKVRIQDSRQQQGLRERHNQERRR